MELYCTDGEYNDILEDLDILWANHNPHNLENEKDLGAISDLIVDMTMNGATKEEIEKVVKYSMDVMDGKDEFYSVARNDIEELRKKYKGRETLLYDQVEHIKGRAIELLNDRFELQKGLRDEKTKTRKLQIMIGMLVHKLGKDVVYDALEIHEEEKTE